MKTAKKWEELRGKKGGKEGKQGIMNQETSEMQKRGRIKGGVKRDREKVRGREGRKGKTDDRIGKKN